MNLLHHLPARAGGDHLYGGVQSLVLARGDDVLRHSQPLFDQRLQDHQALLLVGVVADQAAQGAQIGVIHRRAGALIRFQKCVGTGESVPTRTAFQIGCIVEHPIELFQRQLGLGDLAGVLNKLLRVPVGHAANDDQGRQCQSHSCADLLSNSHLHCRISALLPFTCLVLFASAAGIGSCDLPAVAFHLMSPPPRER